MGQGQINVLKFKNYSPTFFQNTKTVPQLKSSTSIHYKGSNFKQDLLKSSTCLRKYSLNLHSSLLSEEEFHMCTLKIFPKITVNFSLSLKVKTTYLLLRVYLGCFASQKLFPKMANLGNCSPTFEGAQRQLFTPVLTSRGNYFSQVS